MKSRSYLENLNLTTKKLFSSCLLGPEVNKISQNISPKLTTSEKIAKKYEESKELNKKNLLHFNIFQSAIYGRENFFERKKNEILAEDINIIDKKGNTPLYYAVKNNHIQVVQSLILLGAEINKATSSSETVLHLACKLNNYQVF